ncbi:MAG: hypothetical protein GY708_23820 [Actinomycetia bacterium]|nr:hypothetical protein [Actinomycetes bacterium]MCP4084091.1 hypothetical protein [Actinomycetes bacterium]
MEAGYNRYISIDRFDVARASVAYENASAMGRYRYRETNVGVRIVFAKSSRLFEAFGQATEMGDVGAVIEFDDRVVVEGLQALKPRAGDMVTIRYLEAGRTVGGRVIESDLKSSPALVEIEYARLTSIADIGAGSPLPTEPIRFTIVGQEDEIQTLDLVGRRFYHFFELLEGVRALTNAAGSQRVEPVYAPPPVLDQLRIASPAVLLIQLATELVELIPWALAAGALSKAWQFPEKRKTWYEGTGQKKQIELMDLEKELNQLELENRRQEAQLKQEMTDRVRAAFPEAELTDDEIAERVDEHVLPHLRALGRTGVTEIEAGEEGADGAASPSESDDA